MVRTFEMKAGKTYGTRSEVIVVIAASCRISPTERPGVVKLFGVKVKTMLVGTTAVFPLTTVVTRAMLVLRTRLAVTCLWARV